MPRFMQAAGQAARQSARPVSEPTDFTESAQAWESFELAIAPEFHLRMVAWSLGISSVLWYSLILAGIQIAKVWR